MKTHEQTTKEIVKLLEDLNIPNIQSFKILKDARLKIIENKTKKIAKQKKVNIQKKLNKNIMLSVKDEKYLVLLKENVEKFKAKMSDSIYDKKILEYKQDLVTQCQNRLNRRR